jgi:hypothetical protein
MLSLKVRFAYKSVSYPGQLTNTPLSNAGE